jgi:hypothetical protein
MPPSLGPVAAYAFDEGSGNFVGDGSGNGNNGTHAGATWTSSARYGAALAFGGSDWVTVNDSDSLDLSVNGLTLEAWVYPTEAPSGWATVIAKEAAGDLVYGLLLYAEGGLIRPEINVQTSAGHRGVQGAYGLPINNWSHITGTYDGANLQLYVDGYVNRNQVAGASAPATIVTSTEPLRIGGNSVWGEYFKGMIDDVRVYNRALTQSETQRDMITPLIPPLVSILSPPDGSAFRAGSLDIRKLAGEHVRLRFTGAPGRQYEIQASLDLQSWRTIANAVVSADGTFEFEDPDDGAVQRFYRCVTP